MDGRLSELKEKQAEIGNKISLLQATNKRKDEEAAEIRQLIAECRENLNRIKGLSPGSEAPLPPCPELQPLKQEEEEEDQMAKTRQLDRNPEGETFTKQNPCSSVLDGEPEPKCKKDKKKKHNKERVSCKVDLNKMKVRIRGPSEDLKKLDATQLICLLEKYQCQELIINTGDEIIQDPGEIKMIYWLHPGNVIMVAGIIMVAFLVNTNVSEAIENSESKSTSYLDILYVGTFAFHYGMVLWMCFIRGYALRHGLNSDMFNLVDNMVLPKYYATCVLLSALSLYSFLALHSGKACTSWSAEVFTQMIVTVVTFVLELTTICYIVPALIKLRDATDEYILDDDEQENPPPESYKKNLIKLGKLNWTLCLINLLTLIFLGANIYYITSKLDL